MPRPHGRPGIGPTAAAVRPEVCGPVERAWSSGRLAEAGTGANARAGRPANRAHRHRSRPQRGAPPRPGTRARRPGPLRAGPGDHRSRRRLHRRIAGGRHRDGRAPQPPRDPLRAVRGKGGRGRRRDSRGARRLHLRPRRRPGVRPAGHRPAAGAAPAGPRRRRLREAPVAGDATASPQCPLPGQPAAHHTVQPALGRGALRCRDVLQGVSCRAAWSDATAIVALRLRDRDHSLRGQGGRALRRVADRLLPAHARRRQEDRVGGRRGRPRPPRPLQPADHARACVRGSIQHADRGSDPG